ncbi:MAG: ribonuclease HI [Rikenellaceae bacterium]
MQIEITIYSDGSALGNPGAGGYGVVMLSGQYRKEISEGFRLTTNNRMELMGAAVGLETIKREGAKVTIYTDSKYVVDAVTKGWVFKWVSTGFKDKKNPDLWQRFLSAYRKHDVTMVWVKGHADNALNNRCDELAVEAARTRPTSIDVGYDYVVG